MAATALLGQVVYLLFFPSKAPLSIAKWSPMAGILVRRSWLRTSILYPFLWTPSVRCPWNRLENGSRLSDEKTNYFGRWYRLSHSWQMSPMCPHERHIPYFPLYKMWLFLYNFASTSYRSMPYMFFCVCCEWRNNSENFSIVLPLCLCESFFQGEGVASGASFFFFHHVVLRRASVP